MSRILQFKESSIIYLIQCIINFLKFYVSQVWSEDFGVHVLHVLGSAKEFFFVNEELFSLFEIRDHVLIAETTDGSTGTAGFGDVTWTLGEKTIV